jgi:hypothetical protein
MSDRLKAQGYDQLAELAVSTKTKILRAEPEDRAAILADYFHQSVAAMRRVGLAIRVASPADAAPRLRRVG